MEVEFIERDSAERGTDGDVVESIEENSHYLTLGLLLSAAK